MLKNNTTTEHSVTKHITVTIGRWAREAEGPAAPLCRARHFFQAITKFCGQ